MILDTIIIIIKSSCCWYGHHRKNRCACWMRSQSSHWNTPGEGFDPLYDALRCVWNDAAKVRSCRSFSLCTVKCVCIGRFKATPYNIRFFLVLLLSSIRFQYMYTNIENRQKDCANVPNNGKVWEEKKTSTRKRRRRRWKQIKNEADRPKSIDGNRSRPKLLSGINNQKFLQWDTVSKLFANHNKHITVSLASHLLFSILFERLLNRNEFL